MTTANAYLTLGGIDVDIVDKDCKNRMSACTPVRRGSWMTITWACDRQRHTTQPRTPSEGTDEWVVTPSKS